MADSPRHTHAPDIGDESGLLPESESPPGTPRWVKALGIVAVAAVLLVVIVMLAGGHTPPMQHGP